MIHSIKGRIKEKTPTSVVLDLGGLSFHITIPLPTYDKLPEVNQPVEILTYLNVREDALDLYGFLSKDELALFKMLIGVTKIGPKLAVGILSGATPDDFKRRIVSDDVDALTALPGIGPKTARRIIVELKEKFVPTDFERMVGAAEEESDDFNDALSALSSLGIPRSRAFKILSRMRQDGEFKGNLESIVRMALSKA
ncbi:MAG: Holliday junction branch migration protein RuvA [Candidatus Neomarinimicrobiota bacterium]